MKFEIDVPEDEAVEFALSLSELAEDFGIPQITETTYACASKFEDDDETDPLVLPGQVVELGGLIYQVFSIDATGRVVLDVLEELELDDCDGSA